MKEAGIICPKVVCLRKHILVMTFVGEDQKPAPKLKDAVLSRSELESAYEQCTDVSLLYYLLCIKCIRRSALSVKVSAQRKKLSSDVCESLVLSVS